MDLSSNVRAIAKAFDEAEDDEALLEALTDTMEGAVGEFNEKAVAVLQAMKINSMPIEAIKAEIARLQDRKKHIENNVARGRQWLLQNMQASDIEKIEHPLVTISRRKGTMQLDIDEDELPEEYLLPPEIKTKIDREKIKKDIKAGKEIEGVRTYTGNESLLVR